MYAIRSYYEVEKSVAVDNNKANNEANLEKLKSANKMSQIETEGKIGARVV